MKKFLLLLISLATTAQILNAQTWSQTGTTTNFWQCVACSADGSKVIAGAWGGALYLSTNSGTTWTATTETNENWSAVASSADGTELLAAANSGVVCTSADSGHTWVSNSLPSVGWTGAASSADGTKLVVVAVMPGTICCSTNSGATWTTNVFYGDPAGVASSADGSKVFVVNPPQVVRSTDFGATWTQLTNAPSFYGWNSISKYIASSADGKKLVYGMPDGPIYTSANSGDTWTLTPAPGNSWSFVASSADGNTLLAAPFSLTTFYPIYLSTNSGDTWTTNNSPIWYWDSLAISADGGKLFAAAQSDTHFDAMSGMIYFSQSVQSPLISLAPMNGSITLSWLAPSTNFVLQESSDLFDWTDITNTPVLNLNNVEDQVALSPTNNIGFYRLIMPITP
jgi:hypothetical protein